MRNTKGTADGGAERRRATAATNGGSAAQPGLAKRGTGTGARSSSGGARKASRVGPGVASAARRSSVPPRIDPPDEMLRRAMAAKTPRSRGIWARRGLASRAPIDTTIHAMLLRQLYLSHFEQRQFERAREVSEQNLALGVLPEFAHQDAARAKQALGDVDGAASHLRLAARSGPPKRRAFHWWTLGSLLFLAGRYDEAVTALTRASRWGTTDKPLYQGHRAVVRCARGEKVEDLPELIERLSSAPAGQGYGRFVLGQMAFYGERFGEARRHLEAFVRRTTSGRPALAIALDGEVAGAKKTLARMAKN